MAVFRLGDHIVFPPPELAEENGLLAIGGDLSPHRMLTAYRQGIFPWYSENDPILWWFTSPRLVLFPDELKISKRLWRYYKNTPQTFTINKAFDDVITACAASRKITGGGTWITEEMIVAYRALNRLGYAHSVECWNNRELVGGLYGIALGRVFFGESMFTYSANSSKFALIQLVDFLKINKYRLIDCQMKTDHLVSMGAREINGKEFQYLLSRHIHSTIPDRKWANDRDDQYRDM
ncbi:MAG: leucyl/phenylalanyl-tRNA--protein transferase [Desulfocapsaceae bacterium]|jgi:leucyl/phenylalanyl-tRNA--protein transferase|nr:leucyl/phenylalanyl-tRNA--protein transferase [Desulfocapsaceae bacterium]